MEKGGGRAKSISGRKGTDRMTMEPDATPALNFCIVPHLNNPSTVAQRDRYPMPEYYS